jgi:hypothetical protein
MQDFRICPTATAPARSAGGIDLSVWTFDIGTRDTSDPLNIGPEKWGNNECDSKLASFYCASWSSCHHSIV